MSALVTFQVIRLADFAAGRASFRRLAGVFFPQLPLQPSLKLRPAPFGLRQFHIIRAHDYLSFLAPPFLLNKSSAVAAPGAGGFADFKCSTSVASPSGVTTPVSRDKTAANNFRLALPTMASVPMPRLILTANSRSRVCFTLSCFHSARHFTSAPSASPLPAPHFVSILEIRHLGVIPHDAFKPGQCPVEPPRYNVHFVAHRKKPAQPAFNETVADNFHRVRLRLRIVR